MKRYLIVYILLVFGLAPAFSQVVIPLNRKGDVYYFDSRLNGKMVPTVISSYSRAFIPQFIVLEMCEEGLLCGADFKGFQDTTFREQKVRPGVAVNIRELDLCGKTLQNVTAFITGSVTPFFSIGQILLNELGHVVFDGGNLILEDGAKVPVSVEDITPVIAPRDSTITEEEQEEMIDSVVVTAAVLYESGCGYMSKGEYNKALSVFKDAENAMDNEDTEFKKNLYKMMASAFRNLGKKKDMAKYLKKAIAISDEGEERINMQSQLVSYSREHSDLKTLETETLQLVRDICKWKKISVGDCWKKRLRDSTIADAFTDLAVRYEKKYSFQKFYTYYYYGAAWGDERARDYCRKALVEYWNEPVNKIVL